MKCLELNLTCGEGPENVTSQKATDLEGLMGTTVGEAWKGWETGGSGPGEEWGKGAASRASLEEALVGLLEEARGGGVELEDGGGTCRGAS